MKIGNVFLSLLFISIFFVLSDKIVSNYLSSDGVLSEESILSLTLLRFTIISFGTLLLFNKKLQSFGDYLTQYWNKVTSESKEKKIEIISFIILLGFISSVFFHYFIDRYFDFDYPHNTFLFRPENRFYDYINLYNPYKKLAPYHDMWAGYIGAYFPVTVLVFQPFTLTTLYFDLFLFLFFFSLYIFIYIYKHIGMPNKNFYWNMRNIIIVSLLSWPFLHTFDRANVEWLVFLFLSLFIYLYFNNYVKISLVFLAAAISMKLIPAVFIILLICDKRFKEIIYVIVMIFIMSLFSLTLFKGGISENLNNLMSAMVLNGNLESNTIFGIGFGSSLYNYIKFITLYLFQVHNAKFYAKLYIISVIIIFFFLSRYIIKYETVFWRKTFLLVSAMILFPYVSGDYRLLHLFIPMCLFINYNTISIYDKIYAILFGLLMISKSYFHAGEISESSFINPLILVVFSIMIIREGLEKNSLR